METLLLQPIQNSQNTHSEKQKVNLSDSPLQWNRHIFLTYFLFSYLEPFPSLRVWVWSVSVTVSVTILGANIVCEE